jgi:hypothetical protein
MKEEFKKICEDELKRSSITSLPQKIDLMKELNFQDIDELDLWMYYTRKKFVEMVKNF